MKRFDALLWDVDGTLLNFIYAQRIAISRCLEGIGVEPSEEMMQRYSVINDGYWKRLELGEVTKEQLLTGRFTSLFDEYDMQNVNVAAFREKYESILGEVYAYQENSLEICRTLSGRIKQYVITNGVTVIQKSKLKLSGFDQLMDDIFISEQIGHPKPQQEFFERCLKEMESTMPEVNRERLLIIGDSLTSDIKGGVMSGIRTCWYRPGINVVELPQKDPAAWQLYQKFRPDYEIERLEQIFDVLEMENEVATQNEVATKSVDLR